MDPISTAANIFLFLQQIYDFRESLKGNFEDCSRLLERCEVFKPTLQQLESYPNLHNSSHSKYKALLACLEEVLEFARKFLEPTFYRFLVRASFRKGYGEEIAKLNLQITDCASDLELGQAIDFELQRRQDVEDANACFQYCVNRVMEELSNLREQSAEQFALLQADIEANKQYLKDLIVLLGHRRLVPNEQAKVNDFMDVLKGQVANCHREVMAAIQKLDDKVDMAHNQVSEKLATVISLLSEKKQSIDKEQLRAGLLNRQLLPLGSVRWREKDVLGKGAFGQVYKGTYLGTQVAVKVIPTLLATSGNAEKHIRSMENEVILLKEAEHPAILHCYGFARDPVSLHFIIVTDIAPLGSLSTLIFDTSLHFATSVKLMWFVEIIRAVVFVHSRGIKHRDIKAENFLVFFPLHLKLCDFGLAREQSLSCRPSTLVSGTVGFIAPEVWQFGSQYSSDIYSYAMTTVQIITGSHPKQGMAELQVQTAVSELDITWPGVKEALEAILISCCSYDPSNHSNPTSFRPTAREVMVEMTRILSLAGGDVGEGLEICQLASKIIEQKHCPPSGVSPISSEIVEHAVVEQDRKFPSCHDELVVAPASEGEQQQEYTLYKEQLEAIKLDHMNELRFQKERELALLAAVHEADETHGKELHAHKQALLAAEERALEARKEFEASQKDIDTAAQIAAILDHMNLFDIACSGDTTLLQALQNFGALGSVFDVNKFHTFPIGGLVGAFGTAVSMMQGKRAKPPMTALSIACDRGHIALVELLLLVPGIDVNRQDQDGWTAIMYADGSDDAVAVRVLLADGRVNVNLQDKIEHNEKRTVLMHACRAGHTAIAQALLAVSHVEVDLMDLYGNTAFLVACEYGQTGVVRLLLADSRVEVNKQDYGGSSALMHAVTRTGNATTVQALLADKRVDINQMDRNGYTALDRAMQIEFNYEIRKILKEKGAKKKWWNVVGII